MSKKRPQPENQALKNDHGIATIQAIANAEMHHHIFTVRLDDGDEVSLNEEIAKGILKIQNLLKPDNRDKMNGMKLLELLNVYDEAVKDGILIPSKLLLYTDAIKKHEAI